MWSHVKSSNGGLEFPWRSFTSLGPICPTAAARLFFSQVAMLKRHHSNISEDRLVKDGTWVARWVCPGMKHTVPMDLGCTPFLDLFEETPTGITRGISQAVQIFLFLFVKKWPAQRHLKRFETMCQLLHVDLWELWRLWMENSDKTFASKEHAILIRFAYIFKWFAHPIFDSNVQKCQLTGDFNRTSFVQSDWCLI